MKSTIVLLTDFGTHDAYVGVMKGVILGIAPRALVVDLTHGIAPQDVRAGAYTLLSAYRYFPDGTIFCCVIDPGVGSTRRAVAVRMRTDEGCHYDFVCPDNGLLTPIIKQGAIQAIHALDNPRYHLPQVSTTFHGRDIFAPSAAHLAAGVGLEALGGAVAPRELTHIDWPQPERVTDGWRAMVIYIDHFGNLITNLRGADLDPPFERWNATLGNISAKGVRDTFADVEIGAPVAYVGSSGFVELAIRNGSAQSAWQASVGDTVKLKRA